MSCIFCKIINGEIPAARHYENEEIIIISDINPQAKHHFLVIPKEHYSSLCEADEKRLDVIKRAIITINSDLKDLLNLGNGYRLIINTGKDAGQTVFHLHIHILVELFVG